MLNRNFAIALAVAMVLVALYGCSSNSGIKNDRDMYKEQAEMLTGELATANGEVTRLTGELATANMNAADLQDQLDAANGEVARLTGELGTANMNAADLQGQLDAANGEVARLTGELGMANMNAADLQGQLDAANGEVARLTGELGTANGEITRLMGELTAALNDADGDGENDDVTRLMGELTAALNDADGDGENDDVTRLMGELTAALNDADGDGENDDVTRLMGELTAALNDADGDGENDDVTALKNRIYGEGGTADAPIAGSLMARLNMADGTANDANGDGVNDDLAALRVIVYGEGGTADAPIAGSLMEMLNTAETTANDADSDGVNDDLAALRVMVYGEGGTADAPIAGSLMAELTRIGNIANDVDGDGENDEVTRLNGRVDGFETAAASTVNAVNAGKSAMTAGETATDASVKLDARSEGVAGDSRTAQANAQAVMDAQGAAKAAVTAAQTALNNAKAALAADADPEDSLTKALNSAIEVAEDNLKTAMGIADGKALKDAVELVTGDNPDAEGYPMTPAEHGEEVAMDIGGALGPMSTTDGSRMRGDHETDDGDVPDAMANADAVRMDNHIGSTWEEIVGSANVKMMRIASAADDTNVVPAASIAGQPSSSVTTGDLTADGALENGKQYEGTYKGIMGTVFCGGTDCAVTTTDDAMTLSGSWYFTPGDEDEWYVRNEGDTAYVVETLYARFGHWLSENSTTAGTTDVNTFAVDGNENTNTANLNVTTVNTGDDATTLTDTKATYEGDAAGMALYKQFDSSGKILEGSLRSMAFTADVELTATFGTGATLGGEITDFEDSAGNNIDSSWEVELLVRSFDGNNFADGTAVASGQDGLWSAQAFGASGDRPTGVYGGFNAHFTNGHVAGAYATRK